MRPFIPISHRSIIVTPPQVVVTQRKPAQSRGERIYYASPSHDYPIDSRRDSRARYALLQEA